MPKYAIICKEHGQVEITSEDYNTQMSRPDSMWECPECGGTAQFDDYFYEDSLEKEAWIFTFGIGQEHENNYVIIEGDYNSARQIMYQHYGNQWAFQYFMDEEEIVKSYGLTKMEIPNETDSTNVNQSTT